MTSGAAVVALLHSPLVGPASWGSLPGVLRRAGREVVVVEVEDDDRAPYAARYVARAAGQVRSAVGESPVVLVGHSGAGYLLPLVGAARRAARSRVAAYVFVDAGLPPARPASRLDLLARELGPAAAAELGERLDGGGRYPDWTDEDLRELVPDDDRRGALVAALRPRGAGFFREPLPVAEDWPDAPCGYLRLSGGYDSAARLADRRGWPCVLGPQDRPGGHFAAVVDAPAVGRDLTDLLARVL